MEEKEKESEKLLNEKNEESLFKKFHNHLRELKKGEIKIFVLTKEDYLSLKTEILLFKKSGVKIINISEIK